MGYRDPNEIERLALVIGSDALDLQQAHGQREFVSSDTKLPVQGSEDAEAKASPIKWGEVEGRLFRKATLPPGWKKEATSHDMWTDLVDHKGCRRASIFYKAVFYDEDAHIRFNPRYYAKPDYHRGSDGMTFYVYDCGQGSEKVVVYAETPVLPDREKDRDGYYKAQSEAEARAKAWLVERFPDHKNPNAYWDPPAE